MSIQDDILDTLRTIDDPEMPISIIDLGIVESVDACTDCGEARITILPTFVGCPALDMIRDEVVKKVAALPGIDIVYVDFVHDPPWTVDRISAPGRERLREHGVTVPATGTLHHSDTTTSLTVDQSLPCPYCNSTDTELESRFGPTRCRMIAYCRACRNQFEPMKRI